jgi:MoaA/NifB/PqqE/SkfB family radical SAM enzyme
MDKTGLTERQRSPNPVGGGTASQYVELTMHFKCNLKCRHCMIEDTMEWLQPESGESFDEVLATNRREGLWSGIILTGSEVTLRSDLPDLAQQARANGFSHVRIQTHGMKLANRSFVEELVAAGIDEYFVSVTAADCETHDFITRVPGSFDKTMALRCSTITT